MPYCSQQYPFVVQKRRDGAPQTLGSFRTAVEAAVCFARNVGDGGVQIEHPLPVGEGEDAEETASREPAASSRYSDRRLPCATSLDDPDPSSSRQGLASSGTSLVGKRLQIWWATEERYFSGRVDDYDASRAVIAAHGATACMYGKRGAVYGSYGMLSI